MAVGNPITALEYNNLRNKIISILESGSGTRGYGQTAQSSPVFPADPSFPITAQQWNNLRNDLATIRLHQNGQIGFIPQISQGQPVRFGPSHPNTAYDSIIDQLTIDRFNIGASRFTITPVTTTNYTTAWNVQLSCNLTVIFSNANRARYFFNSGGEIRFRSARTGGSSTPQNSSWTQFLQSAGSISFDGRPSKPINFYTLTNNFNDGLFSVFTASTPYSANVWSIAARCNVADNSTGIATEVYFQIVWRDDYRDPDTLNPNYPGPGTVFSPVDNVDGTLEVFIDELKASGSTVPSGTFTIFSPSYSLSPITDAVPSFAPATYAVSANTTNIEEGNSVTFTVTTTNVPAGTTLYWNIYGGPGISNSDFVVNSGTVLIGVLGTGSFSVTPTLDSQAESSEYFLAEVRANNAVGPILATSQIITVNDTSDTFAVTLSAVNRNLTTDLRSTIVALGWDQTARVSVTLPDRNFCGTRVIGYSKADGQPTKHADVSGLTIKGNWPNGLIIQNFGTIVGAGGRGGTSGTPTSVDTRSGLPGGPGITITNSFVSPFLDIINYAVIGGGGGGGGGGSAGHGGGGAAFGARGDLTPDISIVDDPLMLANATARLGGPGQLGTNPNGGNFGAGGRGGNIGQAGLPGTQGFPSNTSRNNGGAPGYAIVGLSKIRSLDNRPSYGNLYGDTSLNSPGLD